MWTIIPKAKLDIFGLCKFRRILRSLRILGEKTSLREKPVSFNVYTKKKKILFI